MPQVTLTIGNKTYRLACAEGEEPRIHALASHFSARVDELGERFPRMPADQLFLMAALIVTDEMFEAREELQATLKQIARLGGTQSNAQSGKGQSGTEMAKIVKDASARLDTLGQTKPGAAKSGAAKSGSLISDMTERSDKAVNRSE